MIPSINVSKAALRTLILQWQRCWTLIAASPVPVDNQPDIASLSASVGDFSALSRLSREKTGGLHVDARK
jgi:hypothetical protein